MDKPRNSLALAEVIDRRSPLSVLLCGVGRCGQEHIGLLEGMPGFQLAGVHALSTANLQRASTVTRALASKDLDRALAVCKPGIVVLATPPSVRQSLVERVAQYESVRAIVVESRSPCRS
jgi:predicted dehydrogenase